MDAPIIFTTLAGLARIARVNRSVPIRLQAEGILKPSALLALDNGQRRALFNQGQAVDVIRGAVRSRLAPITPAELTAALATPITPEARA